MSEIIRTAHEIYITTPLTKNIINSEMGEENDNFVQSPLKQENFSFENFSKPSDVKNKTLEIRFLDGDGNTIQRINPSCLISSSKGNFKIFESPIKDLHNNPISETPWMSLYTRADECLANTNSNDFELCETQIISKRNFWLALNVDDFEIFNELSEIQINFID